MGTLQPTLLSKDESARLRAAYVHAFVDESTKWYRERIAAKRSFSDGPHSTGYLWECLRSYDRITEQRFKLQLAEHDSVLVMADDLSHDQVVGAALWPYQPETILRVASNQLIHLLPVLPEDLYLFDESVSWTLIVTHEDDDKGRIYVTVGMI